MQQVMDIVHRQQVSAGRLFRCHVVYERSCDAKPTFALWSAANARAIIRNR